MIKKNPVLLIVIFVILIQSFELFSQDIRTFNNKNGGLSNTDSMYLKNDSLDIDVKLEAGYFYLENIFGIIPFRDTVLDDLFPYYDPLEVLDKDIIEKGYIGSGAKVLGEININPGFDLGYHQYDLYNKNTDDFRWYKTNVPFASLFFSPGSDVNEFWTKAKFAKDFEDVSINLDYSRMVNGGKYKGQKIKHSDLNVGLWKGTGESRFNTYFNFITNIHQEEDNGGVEDISYFSNSNYSIREVIPVNLKDAVTRMQDYSLVLNEYYKLTNNYELLGVRPYLHGKIGGSQGFYKFYDDDVSSLRDSMIYQGLLADKIGLRNYIKYNKLGSSIGFWGATKKDNYFHFGLDYDYINVNVEPLDDSIVNQMDIYFKGEYGFFEDKINLECNTKYFIGDLAGDYFLNAKLEYLSSLFAINGGIELKKATTPLKFQMLWLTKNEIYNNSFDKTSSIRYFAGLNVEKIGFSLKLEENSIENYLYFDAGLFPKQLADPVNIFKIKIKEKVQVYIFNLDLQGSFYNSSSVVMPLPKYTLKSKFFISPYLYSRHLFIKTGFEFNYWDKYYNYGYNPAIAEFYTQNLTKLENFMRLDYFLSAKVKSFLFFIRFDNILFPLDNNVQFKVIDYPQSDLFYRLGVKWTLLN